MIFVSTTFYDFSDLIAKEIFKDKLLRINTKTSQYDDKSIRRQVYTKTCQYEDKSIQRQDTMNTVNTRNWIVFLPSGSFSNPSIISCPFSPRREVFSLVA